MHSISLISILFIFILWFFYSPFGPRWSVFLFTGPKRENNLVLAKGLRSGRTRESCFISTSLGSHIWRIIRNHANRCYEIGFEPWTLATQVNSLTTRLYNPGDQKAKGVLPLGVFNCFPFDWFLIDCQGGKFWLVCITFLSNFLILTVLTVFWPWK